MPKIPEGYLLWIARPNGYVIQEIDIGDYDLTKPLAASDIVSQINSAIEMELHLEHGIVNRGENSA